MKITKTWPTRSERAEAKNNMTTQDEASIAMQARHLAANKLLQPSNSIEGILRRFNRAAAHSKLWHKLRRVGTRIVEMANSFKRVRNSRRIFTTSRLAVKREMTPEHIMARRYKRVFKGVTGAMTWSDFNRLSVKNA